VKQPTDKQNYTAPDSGCDLVTKHLGKQSSCLECPLPECKFRMGRGRVLKLYKDVREIKC